MEHTKRLKINNDLGLHGRAAAKIVELTKKYKSKLYFKKDGHEEVDGASILSILTLACPRGTEITVRAIGKDAKELLDEMDLLFKNRFGEKK